MESGLWPQLSDDLPCHLPLHCCFKHGDALRHSLGLGETTFMHLSLGCWVVFQRRHFIPLWKSNHYKDQHVFFGLRWAGAQHVLGLGHAEQAADRQCMSTALEQQHIIHPAAVVPPQGLMCCEEPCHRCSTAVAAPNVSRPPEHWGHGH